MKISTVKSVLEENLAVFDRSLRGITQCLPAIEAECTKLIAEVSQKSSAQEANYLFDELLELQGILASLFFGRNISIGKRLESLTREFDRLDDTYIREYWFKKFRSGSTWPDANVEQKPTT